MSLRSEVGEIAQHFVLLVTYHVVIRVLITRSFLKYVAAVSVASSFSKKMVT